MKSTLCTRVFMFSAAFILTLAAAATPAFASRAGETLTCKDIENSPREDFFESTKKKINPDYREQLIRKAAAMFLNLDTSKIPMKRLEQLAEDPATDIVTDPNGNEFALAQIGFGGGNSINYYFRIDSLETLPIASYDGDCIERGTDASFPIEAEPGFDGTAKLECKTQDPEAPVSEYKISFDTENGNYTGSKVLLDAKLNPAFENLTKLAKGETLKRKTVPNNVMLESSKFGTGASVFIPFNNRKEGERNIQLGLTANSRFDAKVWGKVYTNKVGGYHANDAYDFSFPATCTLIGEPATGKLFKRTVKY